MSYRTITKEGCLDAKKQKNKPACYYFKKHDDHPVWRNLEGIKWKKKQRKLLLKAASWPTATSQGKGKQ